MIKKMISLTKLIKEYLFPKFNLNLTNIPPDQSFYLCVLSGERTPSLSNDKRRLLIAKRLAQRLKKNKSQAKIIFCAYKEVAEQSSLLMKKLFQKQFPWKIMANKSFKATNTKIQIQNLKNKFKDNKKPQIVIVSSHWHCPRIKRYLKLYRLFQWQVYAEKREINFLKELIEFIKTIKYHYQGDLKI